MRALALIATFLSLSSLAGEPVNPLGALDKYILALENACGNLRTTDGIENYLRDAYNDLFVPSRKQGASAHAELNFSEAIKNRFGVSLTKIRSIRQLSKTNPSFQRWLVAVLDRKIRLNRVLNGGPLEAEFLLKLDSEFATQSVLNTFSRQHMLALALKDNLRFEEAASRFLKLPDGKDRLKRFIQLFVNPEMNEHFVLLNLGTIEEPVRLDFLRFTLDSGPVPVQRAWVNYLLGTKPGTAEGSTLDLLDTRIKAIHTILTDEELRKPFITEKLSYKSLVEAKTPEAAELGKTLARFFVESPVYGLCDVFLSKQ